MSKEQAVQLEGIVEEALPNAMFKVKLDTTNAVVIGIISGRMRQNKIKILPGDRVEIEISPYDLGRGRITRRR